MAGPKRGWYIYCISRKYKSCDNDKLYFILFVPIAVGIYWIDLPAGRCFHREKYMTVIINSGKYCYNTMQGHVHGIIGNKKNKLEDIIRNTESFTSTKRGAQ